MQFDYGYKLVSVQISGSGDTPKLGQDYSLTCSVPEVNGIVTYQWRKAGESIQHGPSADGVLSFLPLQLSDAGLYTCNVSVNNAKNYNDSSVIMLKCKFMFLITEKCSSIFTPFK